MVHPGHRQPTAVSLAGALFLCHIFCEAWTSSSEGFLVLALIAFGIAIRRGEIEVPDSALYGPLVLYVAGSAISAALSRNPMESLGEVSEAITFLTVPLGLALYWRDDEMRERAFIAFVLLALLLSLWGAWEYFVLGWNDLEHRISGPAAHHMSYSGILAGVSLLLFVHAWTRRSAWLGVVVLLTVGALILTFTRGAWIGWIAGAAVVVAIRRSRFVLYALPVLIVAVVFSPAPVFDRAVSSVSLTQASNLDRIRMIEGGIEMIRDRPLFGVGPGNVKPIYPLYRFEDAPRFRTPHLHNNPVQIWAERGFIPLVAYTGLILVLLARFLPAALRQDPWAQGGLAVTIGLSVAGLFEFNMGDSEVMLSFLDLVVLSMAGMMANRIRSGRVLLASQTSPEGHSEAP